MINTRVDQARAASRDLNNLLWKKTKKFCIVPNWRINQGADITDRMRINIIDTIKPKGINWLGHLQQMPEKGWQTKVWEWTPYSRKQKGKSKHSWKTDVHEAIISRGFI